MEWLDEQLVRIEIWFWVFHLILPTFMVPQPKKKLFFLLLLLPTVVFHPRGKKTISNARIYWLKLIQHQWAWYKMDSELGPDLLMLIEILKWSAMNLNEILNKHTEKNILKQTFSLLFVLSICLCYLMVNWSYGSFFSLIDILLFFQHFFRFWFLV